MAALFCCLSGLFEFFVFGHRFSFSCPMRIRRFLADANALSLRYSLLPKYLYLSEQPKLRAKEVTVCILCSRRPDKVLAGEAGLSPFKRVAAGFTDLTLG